jgi:N6-L-threonylcarbamoyladenine synthase
MILGIDTSNYTTSLAIVSKDGEILADVRRQLKVKDGEKGLRQSEALFQHLGNLPDLSGQLLEKYRQDIVAVALSSKPRPIDGSYMPVFLAGLGYGQVISQALGVPLYEFSHQEGHIRACLQDTGFDYKSRFLAWHLSGGTSELLLLDKGCITVVGGSKDISFGQLLDRIGVALGFNFPCGAEIDALVMEVDSLKGNYQAGNSLSRIPVSGLYCNLSGIETQAKRLVGNLGNGTETGSEIRTVNGTGTRIGTEIKTGIGTEIESESGIENGTETGIKNETENGTGDGSPGLSKRRLLHDVLSLTADCLNEISKKAIDEYAVKTIVFCGGVSASMFLREKILINNAECVFCPAVLSTDNAVGIALMGLDKVTAYDPPIIPSSRA